MSKILIKYEANWADEFDCEGFAVYDKKEWEEHCNKVEKAFEKINKEIEIGFGSNEYFTFESYRDWERCFRVIDISDADISLLQTHFFNSYNKRIQFGTGSTIIDPLELLNDYIEDLEIEKDDEDDFDYGVKD